MSKTTKRSLLYALGLLVLIAFAMWLRYASRYYFHSPAASYLRSAIYLFLFSVWCYSLWERIVQVQVRHYMLAISALMVLWILLRSIKFSIDNIDAERLLWYSYYFPMLFIPMLSVFVSQSLGKGEDFRLPRWTKLLYLPTLLLLLLVLTNDLHQQVFSFPSGILSGREYRYEVGFFFVLGWEALCGGLAFLSMVKNCRIPHSRRIRWLPLVPFALSLAYVYAYAKNVYWVWVLAGDMTVSQCLIFASILECCILATRRVLLQNTDQKEIRAAAALWEQSISVLYRSSQMRAQSEPLEAAKERAEKLGVRVLLAGDEPRTQRMRALIALAISECASNCVRHADGTELYVCFWQKPDCIAVSLTNNGVAPKGKITEGGGLSMLRQRIEESGGKMEIQSVPRFKLMLSLQEKEEAAYEGDDR